MTKEIGDFDHFDVARFWSKVEVKGSAQCWPWRGRKRKTGYGDFLGPSGTVNAHRFAYTIVHGAATPGLVVRHKCDNPVCCNPNHLEIGTHADNAQDRVERGRSAKGEANGRAKLTLEQVRAIKADPRTPSEIAKKLRVTVRAVEFIKEGKTWKHIE